MDYQRSGQGVQRSNSRFAAQQRDRGGSWRREEEKRRPKPPEVREEMQPAPEIAKIVPLVKDECPFDTVLSTLPSAFSTTPCNVVKTPYGSADYDIVQTVCWEDVTSSVCCFFKRSTTLEYPAWFSPLGKECYDFAFQASHGYIPSNWQKFKLKGGFIYYEGAPLLPPALRDVPIEDKKTVCFMAAMTVYALVSAGIRDPFWSGVINHLTEENPGGLFRNGITLSSVHLACEFRCFKTMNNITRLMVERTIFYSYLPEVCSILGQRSDTPTSYRGRLAALGDLLKSRDPSVSSLLEHLQNVSHKAKFLSKNQKMRKLETLVDACCVPGEKTIRHWRLVKISKYAESILRAPVSALASIVDWSLRFEKKTDAIPTLPVEVTVCLKLKAFPDHELGTLTTQISNAASAREVYYAILLALYAYAVRNIAMLNQLGIFRGGIDSEEAVNLLYNICKEAGHARVWTAAVDDDVRNKIAAVISDRWCAPVSFGKTLCCRKAYTAVVVGKKSLPLIYEDWKNVWRVAGNDVLDEDLKMVRANLDTLNSVLSGVLVVYPDVPWISDVQWTECYDQQLRRMSAWKEAKIFDPTGHLDYLPKVSPVLLGYCYELEKKMPTSYEDRLNNYAGLPYPYHHLEQVAKYFCADAIVRGPWTGASDMTKKLEELGFPTEIRRKVLAYHEKDKTPYKNHWPMGTPLPPPDNYGPRGEAYKKPGYIPPSRSEYKQPVQAPRAYDARRNVIKSGGRMVDNMKVEDAYEGLTLEDMLPKYLREKK